MAEWIPQVGALIGGRWRVKRTAFDDHHDDIQRSFYVREKDSNQLAYCVIERSMNLLPTDFKWVDMYARFLKTFQFKRVPPMSKFIEYSEEIGYIYVCMAPVGPTLGQLRRALPEITQNRFSSYTCLHIGIESLNALRAFHDAGFLLRGITTWVVGVSGHIIVHHSDVWDPMWDPRMWRALYGDGDIPARPQGPFRASLKLSSARASHRMDQTRMDEIWSWFYMLIELSTGSLPWEQIPPEIATWDAQLAWAADQKDHFNERPMELLRGSPPEYFNILEYLRSTPSEHEPDYNHLERLILKGFWRALNENGGDQQLDWEPGGRFYEELRHVMVIDE